MFNLDALIYGFETVFTTPTLLVLIFFGVCVGMIFGAIPGLTYTMAVTLFLPLTFTMSMLESVCLFMGLMNGGMSGGLISAILLNMPGTPSSVATTLDGYPMAQRGEAAKALGAGIVFSFVGGIIGVAALVFIAPALASFTVQFGPIEYFAVTLFSMTLICTLSRGSMVKGLAAAMLGMTVAMIGSAPTDGALRYTFGFRSLYSGVALLPVTIGLFAFVQVMIAVKKQRELKKIEIIPVKIKGFGLSVEEFRGQGFNMVRSSIIGVLVGILPGIGGNAANLVSYSVAKDTSKHPEKYGTGCLDGICASEAANNACCGAAQIPLLALGIPGDGAGALTLAAFMLHGINPGPLLFVNEQELVYTIFAAIIMANIFFILVEFGAMRMFVKLLQVKKYVLFPIILILCCIGVYSYGNSIFDVYCLGAFSVFGYLLYRLGMPATPFTLGYLLCEMVETYYLRSLQTCNGDYSLFFTKPIAVVFFAATAISLIYSVRKEMKAKRAQKVSAAK